MAIYKITFGTLKYTAGPTESWFTKQVSITEVTAYVQKWIDARVGGIYDTVLITGMRIAQVADDDGNPVRQASVFYPPGAWQPFVPLQVLTIPTNGALIAVRGRNTPDLANVSGLFRVTYGSTRRVNKYLAWVPDECTNALPLGFNLDANVQFKVWYTAYTQFLKDENWAVRARVKGAGAPVVPILNWIQSSPSVTPMGVAIARLPNPQIAQGSTVLITGVTRRGTDQTSYNGTYFVDSVVDPGSGNPLQIYLRGTEAGDPNSVRLPGKIQLKAYNYFNINKAELIVPVTRKRGKPLGSPSGRARKRRPRVN